ncbi:MAG: hypothetical protein P9L92_11485 [Candidatus Electryonea clarkiae]|nr:hypothetical protein [Candidatus Electryonea clarkiae]MDP8287696.1 hypothetical protein [Candidatus Electryonea clarkiae]
MKFDFINRFLKTCKTVPDGTVKLSIWIILGLPLIAVLAFRLPYFGLTAINSDEGLYSAVARVMQQGGLPYRDAWDHAAPGIFYIYRVIFGIFGAWSLNAVRMAALLAHFASGLIVGFEMRRRHGDIIGTFASVLVIIALGGYLPADTIAALTETFLIPFLLIAVIFILRRSEGGKGNPLLTGIFIALATWFKIHALIISIILLLAAGYARFEKEGNWLENLQFFLKTLTWSGVWYLILVFPLWLSGGFYDYMTMYIGYNIFYMRAGSYDSVFFEGLWHTMWQWGFPHFLTVSLSLAGMVALLQSDGKNRARGIVLTAGMVAGFFAGITGARLFGHYFLPAAAFFAWTAAEGAAYLLHKIKTIENKILSPAGLVAIVIIATGFLHPILIFHGAAYRARSQMAVQGGHLRQRFSDLTSKIREVTRTDEKIWVWGFAPEIYMLARRDCSSRFINANYLVGLIPWINAAPHIDTTPFIIDGSWQLLAEDLKNNPPAAIVDAAVANYQFWGKYQMHGNKDLDNFVQSKYQNLGTFNKFRLYLRRDIAEREGYYIDESNPVANDSLGVKSETGVEEIPGTTTSPNE